MSDLMWVLSGLDWQTRYENGLRVLFTDEGHRILEKGDRRAETNFGKQKFFDSVEDAKRAAEDDNLSSTHDDTITPLGIADEERDSYFDEWEEAKLHQVGPTGPRTLDDYIKTQR